MRTTDEKKDKTNRLWLFIPDVFWGQAAPSPSLILPIQAGSVHALLLRGSEVLGGLVL